MSNVLKLSVVLLVFSALTFATPQPCVSGSLADYMTLGSTGCSIGDKIFYNFDFNLFKFEDDQGVPIGTITPPSAAGVSITPDENGQTMTLDFTGTPFAALQGGLADFGIWYTVKTDQGQNTIKSGQLTAAGSAFGTGFASITENVCVGEDNYAGCAAPLGMIVNIDKDTAGGVANVFFNPLVNKVAVYKDIIVSAGTGFVAFSTMTQSWTQVPEPGAAFALLLGLGGIGYALRRRRTV